MRGVLFEGGILTLMKNTKKFKGKYRVHTTRMHGWDYRSPGCYLITICTKKHIQWFGDMINNALDFSPIGLTALQNIRAVPNHFSNVLLDEHVVMPDHVHMILIFKSGPADMHNSVEAKGGSVVTQGGSVETRHGASLQNPPMSLPNQTNTSPHKPHPKTPFQPNRFGPLSQGSLQSIINQYKGSVTRWCRKNEYPDFTWQRLYDERKIRNKEVLERVRQYIKENPRHWNNDEHDAFWRNINL
jgi:putative transposase